MAACGTDVFVWASRKMRNYKKSPKFSERQNRSRGCREIMGRREKVIINWNFGKYKVEGKVRLGWQQRKSAASGRSKEDEGERLIA